MRWDQGDFPEEGDLVLRHLHHGLLLVAGLLIAGVVLLALLSIPTLTRRNDRAQRERVRDRIFTEVYEALDAALRASGVATITGAQALVAVYDRHLGPLVKLGEGLGGPLEAMRKATATGKVKESPPKEKVASDDIDVHVSAGLVVVSPAPPPRPVERDMSVLEQIAAVRKTLDAFAVVWQKPNVETLLLNAQQALLAGAPYPPNEER
jgi:hypothetical protein